MEAPWPFKPSVQDEVPAAVHLLSQSPAFMHVITAVVNTLCCLVCLQGLGCILTPLVQVWMMWAAMPCPGDDPAEPKDGARRALRGQPACRWSGQTWAAAVCAPVEMHCSRLRVRNDAARRAVLPLTPKMGDSPLAGSASPIPSLRDQEPGGKGRGWCGRCRQAGVPVTVLIRVICCHQPSVPCPPSRTQGVTGSALPTERAL